MYTYQEKGKLFINSNWLGMVEDAIREKDDAEISQLEEDLKDDEPEASIQPSWSEFYEDRLVFSKITCFDDHFVLMFKTTNLAKMKDKRFIRIDFSDIAECEDEFLCIEID